MKKRFLFTTLPTNDLGLLTRSLPVAKELSDRGHTVMFSHPSKSPGKIIANAGFTNIPPVHPLYKLAFSGKNIWKIISSPDFKGEFGNLPRFFYDVVKSLPVKFSKAAEEVWDMDHAAAITGLLNKNFIKAQCIAYLKTIEKSTADVVVDFWNPFASIACRVLNKPLVTINQGDALPNGPGFIWWKQKQTTTPTVVPVLNRVLKEFNLDVINKIEDLNVGDITLVTGMPETDPLGDQHSFQHIGSLLWQNPNAEIPSWLDQLPKDKPVLWLYGGNPSYGGRNKIFDSMVMLQACFKALENEPYQVILSTGHHALSESLPSNFQCVDFVPGIAMAERCHLMIHHGGYGSCQTGLVTGTPSLILPTFSERESNARRISTLGAGEFVLPSITAGNKKIYDVDKIRNKVNELISNSSYREQAKKYGQKLHEYGGVQKVVDLIEQFTIKDSGRSGSSSIKN